MLRSPRLAALALAAPFVLAACGKDAGSTSSSTGAAPAPASAPTARATATAPASGGACSFAGTWTGNYPPGPYPFSGHPLDVTFNADGSGKTHSERADDEIAWKVDGG